MASKKKALAEATQQALTPARKDDPNIVELGSSAAAFTEMAAAYVVDSRDMFAIASDTLAEIKTLENSVEAMRKSIADPLHKAWKATNAVFSPISDALDKAKRQLAAKMVTFDQAERARIAAAEAEAERQRQIAVAEAAAKVEQVAQAVKAGTATTEDLQDAAVEAVMAEVAAPLGATEAPVDRGSHALRKTWKAEVTNVPAFLRYLADQIEKGNTAFANTLEIKSGELNKFAAATQGSVPVPGVRFYPEESIAARGK